VDNICQSIWDKSEELLWRRTCWGTHWELEKYIENLMGTHWELKRNILGTKEKMNKKSSPPLPNLKGKKASHLECLPIGCMKFFFPKELVTIFGLG